MRKAPSCVFDLALKQQSHGRAGLLTGQATGAALAFAEDAHEFSEGMFGRGLQSEWTSDGHMQLVGLGRPASLAASLAGVPLNRRLRCGLLPFPGLA